MLTKYLIIMGQHPSQTERMNKFFVYLIFVSSISIMVPTFHQVYKSICEKDLDGVMECQPHLVTCVSSVLKLLSLDLNRQTMRKIFTSVKEEWELLEYDEEVHFMHEITGTGSKIAQLYRKTLLSSLAIFVVLPLFNPMLDVIVPLNETRSRNQMFKVYYSVNDDQHFYPIYFHGSICGIICVLIIISIDSVYMVIAHHSSALFTICECKIKKSSEINATTNGITAQDLRYQKTSKCVRAHNNAIRFFELLDQITRKNFLLQVGLNMIGISVTAFQTVMHINEPDEAVRYALFFIAQNFHLFYISLPGQLISDSSLNIAYSMYDFEWYQAPVKVQKLLFMMQMRASKPCQLTAGGLYDMNIQNFGTTFKTCISYFTMLLSMKE